MFPGFPMNNVIVTLEICSTTSEEIAYIFPIYWAEFLNIKQYQTKSLYGFLMESIILEYE